MLRKDPLIHFLLLGGALFALLSWLDSAPRTERIVITAAEIEALSRSTELLQGRPPTQQELEQAVAGAVRDEVYYRAALARGLDVDDVVVRQRMIEKMRELTENLVEPVPPETDLVAWFEARQDRFRIPEQVSFEQVFFSPAVRGDSVRSDAANALEELRAGADPAALGDTTPLSAVYQDADAARIRTLFGEDFTADVFAAAVDTWIGPLESGFGWHAVHVLEHTAARDPAYAEVESRVAEVFAAERLAQANAAAYATLSADYDIEIQWP